MPQAFGGLTGGGDLAATSLAGMGGAGGGGSALGDTGFQSGSGVVGGAGDYAGKWERGQQVGTHAGSTSRPLQRRGKPAGDLLALSRQGWQLWVLGSCPSRASWPPSNASRQSVRRRS